MFFFWARPGNNTMNTTLCICAWAHSTKIVGGGDAAISDPLVSKNDVKKLNKDWIDFHSRTDFFPIFFVWVEDSNPKTPVLNMCSYIAPDYYSADVSGWAQFSWALTPQTKSRENPSSVISVFSMFTLFFFHPWFIY